MARNRNQPPAPAELSPPPALSPELLASLPPPPPQAELGSHAADLAELRATADALVASEEELAQTKAQLQACEAALREARLELAQRPANKAERNDPNRRNFSFELANGSRRIVPATSEKQARERLGAEGAGAKFRGCP